ncbi:MAG: hypothetical protein RLZZ599_723, partial [Bacteroidota bacterium]
ELSGDVFQLVHALMTAYVPRVKDYINIARKFQNASIHVTVRI